MTEIIGRDELFQKIRTQLIESLTIPSKPHILYVCGQPGTGKTLVVRKVIESVTNGHPKKFKYAEVNAYSLPTSNHIFLEACRRVVPNCEGMPLSGAYERLRKALKNKAQKSIVLVIDEFDNLDCRNKSRLTRVFDLFEWPRAYPTKFTLLCIANTVSIPEALMARCGSRLAMGVIVFPAYTWDVLEKIAAKSLPPLARKKMAPEVVAFCARKAAARNGDARLCLSLIKSLVDAKVYDLQAAGTHIKTLFGTEQTMHIAGAQLISKVLLMCVLLCIDRTSASCFAKTAFEKFQSQFPSLATTPNFAEDLFVVALEDLLGARVVACSTQLQTETVSAHMSRRGAQAAHRFVCKFTRSASDSVSLVQSHENTFAKFGQQQITLITPVGAQQTPRKHVLSIRFKTSSVASKA